MSGARRKRDLSVRQNLLERRDPIRRLAVALADGDVGVDVTPIDQAASLKEARSIIGSGAHTNAACKALWYATKPFIVKRGALQTAGGIRSQESAPGTSPMDRSWFAAASKSPALIAIMV